MMKSDETDFFLFQMCNYVAYNRFINFVFYIDICCFYTPECRN